MLDISAARSENREKKIQTNWSKMNLWKTFLYEKVRKKTTPIDWENFDLNLIGCVCRTDISQLFCKLELKSQLSLSLLLIYLLQSDENGVKRKHKACMCCAFFLWLPIYICGRLENGCSICRFVPQISINRSSKCSKI